eukprot:1967308-Rhodomonas_salina.1
MMRNASSGAMLDRGQQLSSGDNGLGATASLSMKCSREPRAKRVCCETHNLIESACHVQRGMPVY